MSFLAIGTFDGVHKGHAFIIERLRARAHAAGDEAVALYFDFPPKAVLSSNTDMCMITLPSERERLLVEAGADRAVGLEFNAALSSMEPERFFHDIIIDKFKARGVFAGRDFAFGKDRKGHVEFLRKECAARGIELEVFPFIKSGGHKISSSVVRGLLKEGHMEQAEDMLGRRYSVSGPVIRGEGLGRRLGFPTANVGTGSYKILPRGVFAVFARVDGGRPMPAVANIGFRPTVNTINGNIPLTEVNILDFSEDIYGRILTVEFVSKIRSEKRFRDLIALKEALSRDVFDARRLTVSCAE